MKIVADENLKDIEKCFAHYGEIRLLPGREISPRSIEDADVLLVRSVTEVGKNLLDKSKVSFVGTATSGTDHVDIDYLQAQKIVFAHAHGSNAQAVVDYCLSAIYGPVAQVRAEKLKSVGIIGLGAVGFLLARKMRLLDYQVVCFDPLLSRDRVNEAEDLGIVFSDSLPPIFRCELVSIHTPLSTAGDFPTFHMIGAKLLECLPQGGVLINASRGDVIDERELLSFLRSRPDVFSILDVWECEPSINLDLVGLSSLATPHMAGYSRRGKALATKMLENAFASYLGLVQKQSAAEQDNERAALLQPGVDLLSIPDVMQAAMPISAWSDEFKRRLLSPTNRSLEFDACRKTHINRGEIGDFVVSRGRLEPNECSVLEKLGFSICP